MRQIIILIFAVIVNVAIQAQESSIVLKTEKSIGETISLSIKVSKPENQDQVWIDLNGNGVKDVGEQVVKFGERVDYSIQTKEITIYGPVWVLSCTQNNISNIDISNNPQYLNVLYCGYNQIRELDISKNQRLSLLSCFNNNIESIQLGDNSNLKTLNIYGNKIKEIQMLEIITALPARDKDKAGEIVIISNNRKEQNIISDPMVQVLKEKEWKVYRLERNKKVEIH